MSVDPRARGAIRYSVDADMPGQLHGALVRSTVAHGIVRSIDTSALGSDVVALLPSDIADLPLYGCQIADQAVLAGERVRFVGDVVAAVAAPTAAAARAAAKSVVVDYEELPAVFDALEAVREDAPSLHPDIAVSDNDAAYFGIRPVPGTNICHRFRIRHGDIGAGFAQAEVVVEGTFRTPSAAHVPMEPHASVARFSDSGRLEVITGTQTPFNMRMELAALFGLEEEDVRIVVPPMGGSFGAKTFTRHEAVVAATARKAGRPVKLVLDRSEEFVTLNRHPSVIQVRLGATRSGDLVAKAVTCWADTGAYADCGPGVAQKMGFAAPGPYRIPHCWVDAHAVYTNTPPNGAYRGYGQMQSSWASERAMDMLAARLEISPVELRRRNLLVDGDTYATGETMHDTCFEELLERAVAAVDYERDRRGKGIALILKGMQTPSRASIAIEREGDGYVIRCATTEMGQGARRSLSLLAAEQLGCAPEQVRIPDPDTDRVPYDTRTTSSRSTYMMGRALVLACQALLEDGRRGFGAIENEGGLDPDTGQGVASTHWHQAAASAHLELDEETGVPCLQRVHCAVYAGRVVNKPGAALQNEGSMYMGLGTALFEAIELSQGQVTNANLSDYNIPTAEDVATLTHELVERQGAPIHGLGETALPPIPPAVGNALASLGIELHELPMTPERILDAIDRREVAPPRAHAEAAGARPR
jgi:CO/xanthine dehydrogenase Mo-binding subunit